MSTALLLFCLPDFPATSKWLTEEEREFAVQRLNAQESSFTREGAARKEILETLGLRMMAHYLAFVNQTSLSSPLPPFFLIGCVKGAELD